ncbi:hypothetical protein BDV38DRAFT_232718, partial [Aspergillus pseudotamarii]
MRSERHPIDFVKNVSYVAWRRSLVARGMSVRLRVPTDPPRLSGKTNRKREKKRRQVNEEEDRVRERQVYQFA